MKKQANWYGFDMLPMYSAMSVGQLQASIEQLQNLEACKGKVHVLNDTIIDRVIRLYTEQNESTWVVIEQCRKWREQHNPNEQQLADIMQLEKTIKKLETINTQVLNLARQLKKGTIDRIFGKSDIELAFDFFTQNNRK